jgi:hypothetical protein
MPAALSLTRPVEGSDISTCGTLLDPGLLPYADLDCTLAAECAVNLHGRLIQFLIWVAVAVAVAVGYRVWLRRQRRGAALASSATAAR